MFGTVSIASRRQSSRPIEASEKRPSAGAVSFARATLNFAARSGPNHGLARAPFTGLRVVATSSVGLVVSSAASKRAPVPAIDAHPSSDVRWADRALFIWLYHRCPRILDAIAIVRPETVVRWHRM